MNVLDFPENFDQTDDAQLDELKAEVEKRGEELSEADATEETVAELEDLAVKADLIDTEQTNRQEAATALADRQTTAGDRFRKEEAEAQADDADAEDPDKEEVDVTDAPSDTEPLVEAIAADGGGGVRGDAAALAASQPGRSVPRPASSTEAFMTATSHATHMREGSPFDDPMAVATAIAKKRNSFTSSPTGTRDFLPIAHTDKIIDGEPLGSGAIENFTVLRELQIGAKSLGSLVASGGGCAEYAPSYDFFRLAEVQNPVEQGTQVVQAPRGGINYIVPPSVAQAALAIDISAQDRDFGAGFVQFSAGPKSCVTVSCPTTQSAEVSAVSQCVTFDNLNYKVFPEQVAAFLEDVAVQFTGVKEVFHLDYINTNSTAVTGDYGYGFSRSILHDWTLATVAYRKRHAMNRTADIVVLAPDWAMEAIKLDMALDGQQGLDFWNTPDSVVLGALSQRNIVPIWFNDNPTGITPSQKFNGAQAVGGLNAWPTAVVAYIYAPGTFVRLDGGTLDVGLVRDSTLNRTNDLQLFMEEWIGTVMLGFESIRMTSTLCVNGAGPAGVTAVVC